MNMQEIRQAAFEDEMQKIAMVGKGGLAGAMASRFAASKVPAGEAARYVSESVANNTTKESVRGLVKGLNSGTLGPQYDHGIRVGANNVAKKFDNTKRIGQEFATAGSRRYNASGVTRKQVVG